MGSSNKVKAKAVVEMSKAVDYLRQLASSAEKGNLAIVSDGRGMELPLSKYVLFELKAKEKDGKRELEIELSWSEEFDGADSLDLKIASSTDPEVRECLRSELDSQQQPPCAEV